jgi:hypothetical protein
VVRIKADPSSQSQTMRIEIERKFYTAAIGCLALALMVVFLSHFVPTYSSQSLHALLRVFRKPFVLLNAEVVGFQILTVLICLPLLKATHIRLSVVDSLVLSAPSAYILSLGFCDGFDVRYLAPILTMPPLFLVIFRLFELSSIPSLLDGWPDERPAWIRLALAGALAFQSAILFMLLSGAQPPFRIKVAYVTFFVGSVSALLALIRPRPYLALVAAAVTAINAHVLWLTWSFIRKTAPSFLWCS